MKGEINLGKAKRVTLTPCKEIDARYEDIPTHIYIDPSIEKDLKRSLGGEEV
jgi:hypothetical protein